MWQIISNYIGIVILAIGELIFAKIVLNKKIQVPTLYAILIFGISTFLFWFLSTYSFGILKTLLLYILHIFEFKYLFSISWFKSMFLSFIYAVTLIIPDVIVLLSVTFIMGMDKIKFYREIAGTPIGNLIICILFIVVTLILKSLLRKIIKTEISSNVKIVVLFVLTLISIAIFFYEFIQEYKISGVVIPYMLPILFFMIILFSYVKQMINNNNLIIKYDNILKHMSTYEIDLENERILRHEAKNELRTIRAMICEKQATKDIIEYIDEIVNDVYEIKKEKYAKFGYLPPNGIKGLCYFKTQEAENKGINVSINISKMVKESTIYDLNIKQQRDFGRILGVFLDNAIEASMESNEKQLGIEAYVNNNKEFKLIISNSYNNIIDNNKLGKEKFSTKDKNRGRGLLLVNRLKKSNEKFDIRNQIFDRIYIQTIIIKTNQQL